MTAAGDGATPAVSAGHPVRNAVSPLRQAGDRAMTTSCVPSTFDAAHPGQGGPAPPTRACPRCNRSIYRIPRRFVDRLLSIFVPVHRHRCDEMGCHWEGNLRHLPATQRAPETGESATTGPHAPEPGVPAGNPA